MVRLMVCEYVTKISGNLQGPSQLSFQTGKEKQVLKIEGGWQGEMRTPAKYLRTKNPLFEDKQVHLQVHVHTCRCWYRYRYLYCHVHLYPTTQTPSPLHRVNVFRNRGLLQLQLHLPHRWKHRCLRHRCLLHRSTSIPGPPPPPPPAGGARNGEACGSFLYLCV
jgi:hypothetical protein